MKKLLVVSVAAAALFAASPAMAAGWIFGIGGFSLGATGTGVSFSGSSNFATGGQAGGGASNGGTLSFGEAQSGFGVGIGELPDGTDAADRFGNFAGASAMSGSASQSESTVAGNGSAWNSTGGSGYGSTSISGSGFGVVGGVIVP